MNTKILTLVYLFIKFSFLLWHLVSVPQIILFEEKQKLLQHLRHNIIKLFFCIVMQNPLLFTGENLQDTQVVNLE